VERGEKRTAGELDIEVLAKRVCVDVVEVHTNNMLQIVETTMQNDHKNDMLNLQELWQKRFEESATQINSFKEWFMKTFSSEIVNLIKTHAAGQVSRHRWFLLGKKAIDSLWSRS
jgi:hypothetical protein